MDNNRLVNLATNGNERHAGGVESVEDLCRRAELIEVTNANFHEAARLRDALDLAFVESYRFERTASIARSRCELMDASEKLGKKLRLYLAAFSPDGVASTTDKITKLMPVAS